MEPGTLIADRYEIVRVARGGASGTVYEAKDVETGAAVAAKVIVAERAAKEVLVRLHREVEILSSLDHPNIVACHDAGQLVGGSFFLILEWLSGRDLADVKRDITLSLGMILEIGTQIAAGLGAAHAAGVIHRDIKPANIFLVGDPTTPNVRVVDFGVAKSGAASRSLTVAGTILGTPVYMAPEQATYAMSVDGRADVFSLGVLLYELVTGRLPWSSQNDLARLARILIEPALPVREAAPNTEPALAALIDAMVHQRPDDRPATMEEVVDGLAGVARSLDSASLGSVVASAPTNLQAFLLRQSSEVAIPATDTTYDDRPPSLLTHDEESIADTTELLPAGLLAHDLAASVAVRPDEATPFEGSPRARPIFDLEPSSVSYVAPRTGTPFVGRDPLVDHLEVSVAEAVEELAPTRTLVVGPAGIGKTRLRAELTARLRKSHGKLVVLGARAEETQQSAPYAFLRRVLLTHGGHYPDDPVEVQQNKLNVLLPELARHGTSEEHTRAANPDEWSRRPSVAVAMSDAFEDSEEPSSAVDDRAVLSAYLAEVLQLSIPDVVPIWAAHRDPLLMLSETRRALDAALSSLARAGGLLILIDDAQWIDQASAEVIAELADGDRSLPVAVIAFGLPAMVDEDVGTPAVLLAGEGVAILEVDPVPPRVARDMVRSMVDAPIRGDAIEILIQRAAGNPLFLEQVTKAALETGILGPGRDAELHMVGLKGDAGDRDRIAPTVAAAVRARLGRLGTELETTLWAAAVFGETFWAEGVAYVLDRSPEFVLDRLHKLVTHDLVRKRSRPRYLGATEMEFTHSVIRSVALSRLRRTRRVVMEERVLDYLAGVGEADEVVLARHRATVGEVDRAARLLAKAASKALGHGAFDAATKLVEEGLRMIEGKEVPVVTRAGLLELVAKTAELTESFDVAEQALDALLTMGLPPEHAAELWERRSVIAAERLKLEEAADYAERAYKLFRKERLPLGEANARLAHAEALAALVDDRGAVRGLLVAKPLLERFNDRDGLARASLGLGNLALASADYTDAERRFRESLLHARAGHDAQRTFGAMLGLAQVARLIGDLDNAHRYIDGAARLALIPQQSLTLELDRALLRAAAGERDAALAALRAVAVQARPPRGYSWIWRRATLASAQLVADELAGLPERATIRGITRDVERVLVRARDESPVLVLGLEAALAFLLAATDHIDRAAAYAERAADRLETDGVVHEDEPPRLLLAHARTLQKVGAAEAEVQGSLRKAVVQLELIAAKLDRAKRRRYLDRPQNLALRRVATEADIALSPEAAVD